MKNKALWLAMFLFMISFGLIGYRVIWLQYPLFPSPQVKAWQLDMGVNIKPDTAKTPVRIQIGLPQTRVNQAVIDERISSGDLDVNLLSESGNRVAVWAGIIDTPEDMVGYNATIILRQRPLKLEKPPELLPYSTSVTPEDLRLVIRLSDKWRTMKPSVRVAAVLAAINDDWKTEVPSSQDLALWRVFLQKYGKKIACLSLASAAGLPAREVEGLLLTESTVSSTIHWIAVWTGDAWTRIDPDAGRLYPPTEALLPLTTGGVPLLRVAGAKITDIRWSLTRQIVSPWRMHLEPVMHRGAHFLTRWSLFTLPPEFQTTFRIILLVPIGALIVCVLRNIVGFPTFGIFMPVLMALAFRTTGLFYGLLIFGGIVFIGYAIRRWINDLHLLLVPRLSTILTLIVLCFAVLALIGNKLGLRNMMAVGLLPFVILTMTVERFYVLIEESGVRETMLTTAGSAAVSVLTYAILDIERLQLLFFVFPELLLTCAACQILLGRYTGYRLSEYIRFRALRGTS